MIKDINKIAKDTNFFLNSYLKKINNDTKEKITNILKKDD